MDSGRLSRICDIFHICEQNIKKAASQAHRFFDVPFPFENSFPTAVAGSVVALVKLRIPSADFILPDFRNFPRKPILSQACVQKASLFPAGKEAVPLFHLGTRWQ